MFTCYKFIRIRVSANMLVVCLLRIRIYKLISLEINKFRGK